MGDDDFDCRICGLATTDPVLIRPGMLTPEELPAHSLVRRERVARCWQSVQWFVACASLRAELSMVNDMLIDCERERREALTDASELRHGWDAKAGRGLVDP